MSIERARNYLSTCGLDGEIMEFEMSSATVAEAALAINCREAEIAKTLSFLVEDKPILIVASGNSKIDNAKFKAEFHTKAKMLAFDDVEVLIGHAVGGVCPFGVNEGVTIYLDDSLKSFDTVYPACGSSNSAIKLTPQKLEEIVKYEKWVDVCKSAE
ncbi:MAG: YbaK/EbsC family protein [Ruminococcaceae bacterium]|nr:YbaK/EbsC family protein [Oscillospiraceae bacterium]